MVHVDLADILRYTLDDEDDEDDDEPDEDGQDDGEDEDGDEDDEDDDEPETWQVARDGFPLKFTPGLTSVTEPA